MLVTRGLSQALLAVLQSGWEPLAQPQTSRLIKGMIGKCRRKLMI